MTDISRLFQAFLPPAIFISATGLLVLSINVRLMGMVSRLRQFVHAKHDAAKNGHLQEAEAFTAQIKSIEKRAEMIRRCFLLVLISLAATICSCLLLGLGIYWAQAAVLAVIVFVLALICMSGLWTWGRRPRFVYATRSNRIPVAKNWQFQPCSDCLTLLNPHEIVGRFLKRNSEQEYLFSCD
jgi:hypothetical protein